MKAKIFYLILFVPILFIGSCVNQTEFDEKVKGLESEISQLRQLVQPIPVESFIDTNRDFVVSQDEYLAHLEIEFNNAIANIDKNGDRKMSNGEFIDSKLNRPYIYIRASMDTDGDSMVSNEEFKIYHITRYEKMIEALDEDQDLLLSLKELQEHHRKKFVLLDKDQNKVLSADEFGKRPPGWATRDAYDRGISVDSVMNEPIPLGIWRDEAWVYCINPPKCLTQHLPVIILGVSGGSVENPYPCEEDDLCEYYDICIC